MTNGDITNNFTKCEQLRDRIIEFGSETPESRPQNIIIDGMMHYVQCWIFEEVSIVHSYTTNQNFLVFETDHEEQYIEFENDSAESLVHFIIQNTDNMFGEIEE